MSKPVFFGWLGATWGLLGVIGLLAYAVYRLFWISVDAFSVPFNGLQWLLFIGNTLFMAWSEGYKGFQKSFSPKVASRARDLLDNPRAIPVLLAPLYCMHFFDTTRRQLIVTYALTVMIVILIIVFHMLDQPWRGILDAGVVVGLSWGIVTILISSVKQFKPSIC